MSGSAGSDCPGMKDWRRVLSWLEVVNPWVVDLDYLEYAKWMVKRLDGEDVGSYFKGRIYPYFFYDGMGILSEEQKIALEIARKEEEEIIRKEEEEERKKRIQALKEVIEKDRLEARVSRGVRRSGSPRQKD